MVFIDGFSLVAARGGYCLLWRMGSRAQGLQELWHRVYLLHSTWDLPGSGIESVSPALAGGFFTTEPSGKPNVVVSSIDYLICERCGVYPFATVL